MKPKHICVLVIFLIVMQGCLVKSLHPFYTDKDLVFKQELVGKWTDLDSATWVISQHKGFTGLLKDKAPVKAYDITFTDNKGTSKFVAHLFTLDSQLFLDFYPDEINTGNDLGNYHLIPAHSLAKVKIEGGKILISWYNEEWLVKLFNQNRVRIAHERIPYDPDDHNRDNFQVILTAPTGELQKFIIKYGNDPQAFKNDKDDLGYTILLTKQKS
jgi:hypothetical protein